MSIDAKRSGRALLRRARATRRLVDVALDRRRELGLGKLALQAVHRGWNGAQRAPFIGAAPGPGAVMDAIYAIGYWPGEPKRYRVYNMAEGLRAAGYVVHVMPFECLEDIARLRWRASVLVLFRAEYDRLVGTDEVLTYASATGMQVVYDVDDLVFEPQLADRIDGLRFMGRRERRRFIAAMASRRQLLLACDLVTVSTAPLSRAVAALGRPSAVVPNSLNEEQLRLAAKIADTRQNNGDFLWVGYFSGSRTHQRDFMVCERALLEQMDRHPQLGLRIIGYLELGEHWQRYATRVQRIGFLASSELLRAVAGTDINIAPLEIGNPFCEAKSELKFFEAAIVGVPTVASATEPFRDAIEDGVSGFLVRDVAGWRDALEFLITSASCRQMMGQAARARAFAQYTPQAIIPRTIAALGLCREQPRMTTT